MSVADLKKIEEENNRKGMLFSLSLHTLLFLALFLVPIMPKPIPPPVAQIQVELPKDLTGGGPALGLPDEGKGDRPSPGKPDPTVGSPTPKEEPKPEKITPEPAHPKPVFTKPAPAPVPQKPVQTTEDPNAEAIRRQAADAKKKQEEDKFRQQEANRQKQAQEQEAADNARKQAEANSKFGNRFGNKPGTSGGGGNGTGRGNTGKPGNQGTQDGDPNSSVLSGLGKGAGIINGFGGRGVKSASKLHDDSQKSGRVVVYVCIDSDGNVTSAKFKAQGSTTTDEELTAKAESNARSYRFQPGSAETQCGTITYNFIVK